MTKILKNGQEIKNLPSVILHSKEFYADLTAIESVCGVSYTYSEMEVAVRFIASMLHSAGIEKGDKVAILSENSPHWVIAWFGILATGATTVPILPDFRGTEIKTILEHAGAKSVFVSSKFVSRLEDLPASMEMAINLEGFQVMEIENGKVAARTGTGEEKLTKLQVAGESFPGEEGFFRSGAEDLASIIYTSGTTGRSKGVMLSHRNILSNAVQSGTIHEVVNTDRFLSMLPLAHTYECTIGMVVPLVNGACVHYIDKPPTASYLAPILQRIKPSTILTVPLIMEKIFAAKIKPALYGKASTRALMKFAPTRKILSRAASGKLQKYFGGKVRFYGIGGAPLSPEVEEFLLDGNFPYAIGYGLTETSPMLAGFNPSNAVYRSVGTVLEGVDLRIDNPDPVSKEGEVVAKGPNIMKGYYKDQHTTDEAFTEDGYFRTGDLGYISGKGILFLRGRLKNMILGPNGENIYPEEIEAVINREDLVHESLVMEDSGKLVAKVHLNLEHVEEKFKHLKENASLFQQHMQERADEILEEIRQRVNQHVARNSKLQLMVLQVQPFEKTPTQKIKRFLYK